jgi:hypothetical protein
MAQKKLCAILRHQAHSTFNSVLLGNPYLYNKLIFLARAHIKMRVMG